MADVDPAELEKTITMIEDAIAVFSDARTDAIRVAAQGINTLEPTSTAVESAKMLHELVQIANAALTAEQSKRVPTYGFM